MHKKVVSKKISGDRIRLCNMASSQSAISMMMITTIIVRILFRLYCLYNKQWYWTFAWKFYTQNNRSLNVCRTVLHCEQLGLERLHGGFAPCAKGLWTFACRFCVVYKRALNACRTVLHHEQKVLERLHDGFARVQKGLEVSSRDFCTCTKGHWTM